MYLTPTTRLTKIIDEKNREDLIIGWLLTFSLLTDIRDVSFSFDCND